MFSLPDANDDHSNVTSNILTNMICPILFETIVKGDPQIFSVNIVWINPDAITWMKNPHKSRRGELALDIVLEKSVCKRSGDVWRIVLDSCLPVLHLINTRRSIPYAIKHVQELLGISCVFDQAVQRLSTYVVIVAKGVLNEHLILLASSVTCSGNLIGFNSAGYKALSRISKFHLQKRLSLPQGNVLRGLLLSAMLILCGLLFLRHTSDCWNRVSI